MSLSDILALVFGASTLLTTLAVAFMWVGQQKAKQTTQDARIAALEAKIDGHGETAQLVTRLEERLMNLADALKRQPELIGAVVAAVLKETMRR